MTVRVAQRFKVKRRSRGTVFQQFAFTHFEIAINEICDCTVDFLVCQFVWVHV